MREMTIARNETTTVRISGTSTSRVVFGVDAGQAGPRQVRIDLGRRDICVAQHQLQAAQIGPPLEQVGRERMPQLVRTDRLVDARRGGVVPQQLEEASGGDDDDVIYAETTPNHHNHFLARGAS